MSRSQILHNKIQCVECGDVVESMFRHDFQQCGCGKSFVDGGQDYVRYGGKARLLTEYTTHTVGVSPCE